MNYKILFFSSLIFGSLIAISAYSWMSMWMGLEINLLSVIPLMTSSKNMMASEAALKYFIVQAMSSTLLLFSMIFLSMNFSYVFTNLYLELMLTTALLTKMGAAPFHFWFPEIMEGLNWNNSIIMLTWQKITPMILLLYTNTSLTYLYMVILWSMMTSGIMGLNQTSMRKILAYSSINHIGWMLSAILTEEAVWFIYFIIYTVITLNIIMILKIFNIFHLNHLIFFMSKFPTSKLMFNLNFLSLGGLPPFLGFLPKWMTIQSLTQANLIPLVTVMIIMTLVTLYFYIRTILTISTMNQININSDNPPKFSFLINFINLLNLFGLSIATTLFNFI